VWNIKIRILFEKKREIVFFSKFDDFLEEKNTPANLATLVPFFSQKSFV